MAPVAYSQLGERLEETIITGLMSRALANRNLLSLAAGFTDNETLPRELVSEAVAALLADGGDPGVLQYGTNAGYPRLRETIAARLCAEPQERPDAARADAVFVTNGSQQALYLAMQTLCDPGDLVLVERPSYFVYLEMLRGLGIEAVEMPTTAEGALDLNGLEGLIDELKSSGRLPRLKAVYLQGYFANPSSRSLSRAEKAGLAERLATRGLRLPLIEDAAYRQLYYREPCPVPSLLSLPEADGFPVLYLGTLTKPFASGLKVGYGICNHHAWREKMLGIKGHHDFGTANFPQRIFDWVLYEGRLDPYLDGLRRHYAHKAELLQATFASAGLREAGWSWTPPE
ncbi:MAG: aminotransferase class I/II-fold pyridoxal phosphate-dependent enzyme, partial [Verrucomicrobiota bacterium]